MRLYMKQKVFSMKDRFTIKNEAGEDVYTVEGKPFLTNEVWTAPAPASRFFRVWVALPE